MKILKQKNILITALLSILILITPITQANANMFNKFKKGFYFEKYNTFHLFPKTIHKKIDIEEARNALLEVHPIGSDARSLFQTLDKAGAKVKFSINRSDMLSDPIREREYFSREVSKSASVMHNYQYDAGIWLINPITWTVLIFCDSNGMITNVYLGRDYTGL